MKNLQLGNRTFTVDDNETRLRLDTPRVHRFVHEEEMAEILCRAEERAERIAAQERRLKTATRTPYLAE